jgi:hypothetical protein
MPRQPGGRTPRSCGTRLAERLRLRLPQKRSVVAARPRKRDATQACERLDWRGMRRTQAKQKELSRSQRESSLNCRKLPVIAETPDLLLLKEQKTSLPECSRVLKRYSRTPPRRKREQMKIARNSQQHLRILHSFHATSTRFSGDFKGSGSAFLRAGRRHVLKIGLFCFPPAAIKGSRVRPDFPLHHCKRPKPRPQEQASDCGAGWRDCACIRRVRRRRWLGFGNLRRFPGCLRGLGAPKKRPVRKIPRLWVTLDCAPSS